MTGEPENPTETQATGAALDPLVEQRLAELMTPSDGAASMWFQTPVILRLPYGVRAIDEVPEHLSTSLFDVYLTRHQKYQNPNSRRNWEFPVPWWREKFKSVSARPLFLRDDGGQTPFNEVVVVCRYVQSFYEVAIKLVRVDADLAEATDQADTTYLTHQRAQHVAVLERAEQYIRACLRAALQDPTLVYRGEGRWAARVPGVDCARAMEMSGHGPTLPDKDELWRMGRYVDYA